MQGRASAPAVPSGLQTPAGGWGGGDGPASSLRSPAAETTAGLRGPACHCGAPRGPRSWQRAAKHFCGAGGRCIFSLESSLPATLP